MPFSDIQFVFQWWSALFLVGVAAFPLTKKLFSGPPRVDKVSSRVETGWPASLETSRGWYDQGYLFSKAVGMAVVTYIIYLLGTLQVAAFDIYTIFGAMGLTFFLGTLFHMFFSPSVRSSHFSFAKSDLAKLSLYIVEELFFFGALLLWSWVKGHEPSIQGLEKFMDYGFIQTILNSQYFPVPDMWYAGFGINYYYFGHIVTAVLTKLSGLDLGVTFNLMLASMFAFTLTMSFSIGFQLIELTRNSLLATNKQSEPVLKRYELPHFAKALWNRRVASFVGGIITAFLVTLAGNMQTLYAFTKGYTGDNVVPFWTVLYAPAEFFSMVGEGMERYWYANATRFIPFTIHEFPSYSFVVSDIHGHVLSLPFVFLAIALLIVFVTCDGLRVMGNIKEQLVTRNSQRINLPFYGFLLAILLMTNAFDGPIYFGLLVAMLLMHNAECIMQNRDWWKKILVPLGIVGVVMVITALPFLTHFSSFATGIGVNCPAAFLANTKIGPFIFEGVEKCQKSPLWMMTLLWGFFWYTGAWLFVKKVWKKEEGEGELNRILKVFFLYSIFLIIVPEFLYAKDIYPAHFRSNTMFKLGYEAFIMWSIVAGYVIVHFLFLRNTPQNLNVKIQISNKFKIFNYKILRIIFFVFLFPQLFLVSIYPIFSIRSYFGELKQYKSLYGLAWLEREYPDDYAAISWLKDQIKSPTSSHFAESSVGLRGATMTGLPVIVEADGDSYTDYNHVSAFAGTPTIVGWAVHEWLWRGSYNVVSPRREEVRILYESEDIEETKAILSKYAVQYILVGPLERKKFTNLQETKIQELTTPVFQSGETVLYEVGDE